MPEATVVPLEKQTIRVGSFVSHWAEEDKEGMKNAYVEVGSWISLHILYIFFTDV
jgi:hypothetical protein